MGVHGLTTYLRDHRRALSTTIELPLLSGLKSKVTEFPVVIDGWSFIYTLYQQSTIPWVYGGEYQEFHQLVKSVVEAWLKVGLTVHFVFDGAYPDIKFPTLITRLAQSHIQPGLLFFRTSAASRSTPRSLNETRILPPLAYATCVQALKDVQVEQEASLQLHFADEEGDPYAVELAGRLNGYVVGNDSDFVVLNTEGYRGYIPIDDMVWTSTSPADEAGAENNADDDFQVVSRPKANRKAQAGVNAGRGLVPPTEGELHLSVTAYSPTALAQHFKLPVTLLPLLGAIVGNDFTAQMESNKRRIQSLLFERQLSVTQRLDHAASVIRTVLTPNPNHRKSRHEVGSVMDLIERTVNILLSRFESTAMGPGEIAQVVDNIVEATLQYAIPKPAVTGASLWPSPVCALHRPDVCPFLPMLSRQLFHQLQDRDIEDEGLLLVREKIIDAYRSGMFTPKNMDVLSTATCWPKMFLENPDTETVVRSIGQPIREWVYSILDDAVGLPDPPAPDEPESDHESQPMLEDKGEESDQDELVDVVESDSEGESESNVDFLAPLRGQLDRLHGSDDEATEPPASVSSHRTHRLAPPVVTEYIRRGTRVAPEEVVVTPLEKILESLGLANYNEDTAPPLLLRPEDEKLGVMLKLLKSDTPTIRSLAPTKMIPVLVARWLAQNLHSRYLETNSKEREREMWTATEARCFLAAFASSSHLNDDATADQPVYPEIADRHVQLAAQALSAMEAIEQLSQALLLGDRVAPVAHLFSGKLFHSLLNGSPRATAMEDGGAWNAVEQGIPAPFKLDQPKKSKRAKGPKVVAVPPKMARQRSGPGFYALLDSDMN
ncbi:hypothetical protein D9611_004037 [Ephemerocybe angulata]|uniref:Asteroid domain-containing protein n=1 Tax=Ephemerocybe angulata TaxID=980116 RepID=A0A8H5EYW1_9AGAR|nr:hypothetical protein D9611_004037 [Tulosesus angulatus]